MKRRVYVGVTHEGVWEVTQRINNSYFNYFGPMSKEAADFMILNVGNPDCRHELDAEVMVSALEEC